MKNFLYIMLCVFVACTASKNQDSEDNSGGSILFKNANIINDSIGALSETDILVENGKIVEIGKGLSSADATTVDLTGKIVTPAIISAHMHIGTVKGTTNSSENYTPENILNQLNKYASYGVLNLQVMGTDRPVLFANGLYDSIRNGLKEGSRMLSAGYGFNVPQANIDPTSAQSLVYRPTSPSQVPAEIDSLAKLNIRIVKMWVDDFNKTLPKMDPAVYHAIIDEAHKKNMKVAAHVYYLSDARKLVEDGIDILAHSIRDSVVDDAFLSMMKTKNTVYIPTLTLEKFAHIYGGEVEWINDPFFKASLEPGVYEMITSEKYKTDIKNSPATPRSVNAFNISLINLKKIFDAGILVALGTDSGAFPVRTQGFSEHLEMQLLVEAGLTPAQALVVATKNSAKTLSLDDFGSIEKGKIADLLILNNDPLTNIKNTRDIFAVYKAGVKVK